MGFSYIKSKFIVFKASQPPLLNPTFVFQQDLGGDPFGDWNPSTQVHMNLDSYVNRFDLLSSVATFFRFRRINPRILLGSWRRYYLSLQHSLWRWVVMRNIDFIDFDAFFRVRHKIPYLNRAHLVIASDKFEREAGMRAWKNYEERYSGKILSATHPESVRVKLILRDLVQAMHSGLRLEKDCRVSVYVPNSDINSRDGFEGSLIVSKKVQESREKRDRNRRVGLRYGTKHLDGLDWEVMVIDSDYETATCIPHGKIIIYMGLLRKLKSDEMVATALAHEVGHSVARHATERLMIVLWTSSLIGNPNFRSGLVGALIPLLVCPIGRRGESEADHIGLMLMASAGYDPREAPKFYRLHGDSCSTSLALPTHPSGEWRAKLLSEPQVMGNAMAIFKDVRSGHGVNCVI